PPAPGRARGGGARPPRGGGAAAPPAAASAALTPRIAPATAYALGVLHADQRQQVEAARYAFSRLWHRQMADVS
ncbi:hypothetical protein ODJ75_25205, partial [Streptomyces sp. HB2AG]|nr:hypothetical protein [Streptomyces sp. HB2AG]